MGGIWAANKALRHAELELARQAETAYRLSATSRRLAAKEGRRRGTGARISSAV
jgi:hypothetical protein